MRYMEEGPVRPRGKLKDLAGERVVGWRNGEDERGEGTRKAERRSGRS